MEGEIPAHILAMHREKDAAERPLVLELCSRLGYGRVMHLVEELWRDAAIAEGHTGSEHSTGPCAALLVPCPCTTGLIADDSCDWCCGSQRVTERVRRAILDEDGRDHAGEYDE